MKRRNRFTALCALAALVPFIDACAATGTDSDEFAGGDGETAGGGNAGVSDSDAPNGTRDRGACAADEYNGQLIPLDMYILLDRSGSMDSDEDRPDRWGPVTGAVGDFLDASSNQDKLSVGLGLFPVTPSSPPPTPCTDNASCGLNGPCMPIVQICIAADASCDIGDYVKPVVPVQALPGVASSITSAMGGTSPEGSTTTMRPALAGALAYMRQDPPPGHMQVVVLATDGKPSSETCQPNSVGDVASLAAAALSAAPSVKTFVIGIGDAMSSLDQIAASGGTDHALIVSNGNEAQEFLDRLNQIRGAAACHYQIPVPKVGQEPDYDKLNVWFTPDSTGVEEAFPRVDSAAQCQGETGWYYDNPAAPTQIILCPASCKLTETQAAIVTVELGCVSIVR